MRNLLFTLLLFPILAFANNSANRHEECIAFAQIVNTIVMHRVNGIPAEQVTPHMVHHGFPKTMIPRLTELVAWVYNPEMVIREASDIAAIVNFAYSECIKKSEEKKT